MPSTSYLIAQPEGAVLGSEISYTDGKWMCKYWDKRTGALRLCPFKGIRNNGDSNVTVYVHFTSGVSLAGTDNVVPYVIAPQSEAGCQFDYVSESGTSALTNVLLFPSLEY